MSVWRFCSHLSQDILTVVISQSELIIVIACTMRCVFIIHNLDSSHWQRAYRDNAALMAMWQWIINGEIDSAYWIDTSSCLRSVSFCCSFFISRVYQYIAGLPTTQRRRIRSHKFYVDTEACKFNRNKDTQEENIMSQAHSPVSNWYLTTYEQNYCTTVNWYNYLLQRLIVWSCYDI